MPPCLDGIDLFDIYFSDVNLEPTILIFLYNKMDEQSLHR